MPDQHDVEEDEPAQGQGQQAGRRLRCDDGHSLGPHVGDDPAEEAQHQDGHELHRAQQADVDDRLVPPNQRSQEPAQGEGLHPRPGDGDQLAKEEEPEVAVPQGAASSREPDPPADDHRAASGSSAGRVSIPSRERSPPRTTEAAAPRALAAASTHHR